MSFNLTSSIVIGRVILQKTETENLFSSSHWSTSAQSPYELSDD